MNRVGIGIDVHRFAAGRKLIIGGVEIPHEQGLEGHSDADVLAHAIADALLGAAALGDIGKFYPPSEMKFKNMDSMVIVRECAERVRQAGGTHQQHRRGHRRASPEIVAAYSQDAGDSRQESRCRAHRRSASRRRRAN